VPIYEYECTRCGQEFEVIQGFSDKPLTKCEVCGGRVRKLVSQSSFHLKGSGWYVTDYASKHPGSKPASASKDADGSGGKSDNSTASSSDTKTGSTKTESTD